MPHAEIPPPDFTSASAPEERGSGRQLDDVGVENVLASMIEGRRRASQPARCELEYDFVKAR